MEMRQDTNMADGRSSHCARWSRLFAAILIPVVSACVPDDGATGVESAQAVAADARPAVAADTTTAPLNAPAPLTASAPSATSATSAPPATSAPEQVDDTVPSTTASAAAETASTTPADAQWVETFDNNTGLDRFRYGVYHRDGGNHEAGREPVLSGWNNSFIGGEWTGDHDTDCNGPDTQRPLKSDFKQDTTGENEWFPWVDFHVDDLVYVCKDHLMTSMGDIAAYSVVWFAPDATFDDVTEISFDVNLTDLGPRQWIKWGVVSESLFESTYMTNVPTPGFLLSDIGSSDLQTLQGSDRVIATWSGAGTESGVHGVGVNGERVATANPTPEDKATRHPVSLTDNGDGTITASAAGQAGTVSGSFPECPCRVVFYDHNYTPDKDGTPIGHTWHWDNIIVR